MAASFHAYVCMLEWLTCMTGFIYGLTATDEYPWLWLAGLVGIFAMPIINELVLCLKGRICKRKIMAPSPEYQENLSSCIPIVYSKGYNIHAFGVEKCHPFDASKYRRIFA